MTKPVAPEEPDVAEVVGRVRLGHEIRRLRLAYRALSKMDRAGQMRALHWLSDRLATDHNAFLQAALEDKLEG